MDEKNILAWLESQPALGAVWTVHRIDRETSGIVLFARSEEAHQRANQWFQERKVRKDYIAIIERPLPLPVQRQRQPMSDGKPALTQLTRIERPPGAEVSDDRGFVQAWPATGRRHQIRYHLAALGFPIWGDARYGSKAQTARIALHARSLELPSGEKFWSDPKPDFFAR